MADNVCLVAISTVPTARDRSFSATGRSHTMKMRLAPEIIAAFRRVANTELLRCILIDANL